MIKEKAYGKINLFLNVTNKRDDGYHDLEMVMASIALHDVLSFEKIDSEEILIESNVQITKDVEDNLVYKIAMSLKDEFEIDGGVKIKIRKNIPIAAGLAGGSADAAATFRGLNRLWDLGLSLDDLATRGLEYGSDIPFCIYNKLCVAKGRGEDLVFLDKKLNLPILLVNPNIKIATSDIFGMVKKEDICQRKTSTMTSAILNGDTDTIITELFNSLEKYTFKKEPRIKEIKDQIINHGLFGTLMSGSGATIFSISKDKKLLKEALDIFNDYYYKKLTKIR